MHKTSRRLILLLALATAPVVVAAGVKRASPPKFPERVSKAFFPDAREKLVGERPKFEGAEGGETGAPGGTSDDGQREPALAVVFCVYRRYC